MRIFLCLLSVLCFAACVEAPHASPKAWSSRVEQGRHLFATRCATCHGLPDPAQCNAATMDSMSPPAGLTVQERALVEAYLASARK